MFFKLYGLLFGLDLFVKLLEVPLLELFLDELLLLFAEFALLKLFVGQKFPLMFWVVVVTDGHWDGK